jgi:hypothetical protein
MKRAQPFTCPVCGLRYETAISLKVSCTRRHAREDIPAQAPIVDTVTADPEGPEIITRDANGRAYSWDETVAWASADVVKKDSYGNERVVWRHGSTPESRGETEPVCRGRANGRSSICLSNL